MSIVANAPGIVVVKDKRIRRVVSSMSSRPDFDASARLQDEAPREGEHNLGLVISSTFHFPLSDRFLFGAMSIGQDDEFTISRHFLKKEVTTLIYF